MTEEYFADGSTQELIGKLSKVPDLEIKQLADAATAKSLGVVYVLDGSIRKSDTTLRIDARLVRSADGGGVWSETYDRPAADRVAVQQDVANEVVSAIRTVVSAR